MALSQALMDQIATLTGQVLGELLETLTYVHRETRSSAPVSYGGLQGFIGRYSEHMIAEHLALNPEVTRIQRDDRRLRLATARVTLVPTLAGAVQRADGSLWQVLDIGGGVGRPHYIFHLRRMPGV